MSRVQRVYRAAEYECAASPAYHQVPPIKSVNFDASRFDGRNSVRIFQNAEHVVRKRVRISPGGTRKRFNMGRASKNRHDEINEVAPSSNIIPPENSASSRRDADRELCS